MAKILQPTEENLRDMRKFLRLGGLVAIPTETVYGLAANALDAAACARIFEAKGRPSNDPLICHLERFEDVATIAIPNDTADKLADAFWPGPLSFVLPKKPNVPDLVTAGLDSVAVRCPSHPVFRALIDGCDFPLAAPSANPFAYISPTHPHHVDACLGAKIEYILDGGPSEHGVESTIIDLRDPAKPTLLRHGALPAEEIESILGFEIEKPRLQVDSSEKAIAPGALPKHYSPRTPLELRSIAIESDELARPSSDTAYLLLTKPDVPTSPNIHWLSDSGELKQIASNLYKELRALDKGGYRQIIAEEAPELGLGLAINDRLRRASNQ